MPLPPVYCVSCHSPPPPPVSKQNGLINVFPLRRQIVATYLVFICMSCVCVRPERHRKHCFLSSTGKQGTVGYFPVSLVPTINN
jgi:hypothetical protein